MMLRKISRSRLLQGVGPLRKAVSRKAADLIAGRILPGLDTLTTPFDKGLSPARWAILFVLPAFLEKNLKDAQVQEAIIRAADQALVRRYPFLKVLAKEDRQRILRQTLKTVLAILMG